MVGNLYRWHVKNTKKNQVWCMTPPFPSPSKSNRLRISTTHFLKLQLTYSSCDKGFFCTRLYRSSMMLSQRYRPWPQPTPGHKPTFLSCLSTSATMLALCRWYFWSSCLHPRWWWCRVQCRAAAGRTRTLKSKQWWWSSLGPAAAFLRRLAAVSPLR